MTNTTYLASALTSGTGETPKRSGSLSTMKLAELQGLAGSLGLTGTAKMRKGDLVIAIRGRQAGGSAKAGSAQSDESSAGPMLGSTAPASPPAEPEPAAAERPVRTSRRAQRSVGVSPADEVGGPAVGAPAVGAQISQPAVEQAPPAAVAPETPREESAVDDGRPPRRNDRQQGDRQQGDRQQGDRQQGDRQQGDRQQGDRQQGD
ncbi:MAG: Rho termination factor N-terminal domain-containing protein, partial [Dermatophilaceae bacterium]|nr:Rho termination factor N-terminal domain-containing protein [Dermatophilaceae bacterium]